jgi:hypothetical protein
MEMALSLPFVEGLMTNKEGMNLGLLIHVTDTGF